MACTFPDRDGTGVAPSANRPVAGAAWRQDQLIAAGLAPAFVLELAHEQIYAKRNTRYQGEDLHMHGSIPVAAMERLAEERRQAPRITAAAGWPAPPKARHLGDSIGAMLIRPGRWIEGASPEPAAAQSPQGA